MVYYALYIYLSAKCEVCEIAVRCVCIGFVASGVSATVFNSSGIWSNSPDDMACVEAVALLASVKKLASPGGYEVTLEGYGPGLEANNNNGPVLLGKITGEVAYNDVRYVEGALILSDRQTKFLSAKLSPPKGGWCENFFQRRSIGPALETNLIQSSNSI